MQHESRGKAAKVDENVAKWMKIYVRAQHFFKRLAMGTSNSRPSKRWVEQIVFKNYPTSVADPDLEAGAKVLEIVSLQTLSPNLL